MPLQKSCTFASTSEDIRFIASQCSHGHRHQSIRALRTQRWLSQQLFSGVPASPSPSPGPSLRSEAHKALPLQECARLQPSQPEPLPRAPIGRSDSSQPLSPLKDLSNALSSWLQSSGLRASIAAHIIQQKPDCPLSEAQDHQALLIIIQTLGLGELSSPPLLHTQSNPREKVRTAAAVLVG